MNKILNKIFLIFIIIQFFILLNFNYVFAYKNNAFSIDIPSKYMGKDCISNNYIYGLGKGSNFLFITEENSSENKIDEIKKSLLDDVKLNAQLYGKENIFYELRAVKINNTIAFTYQIENDEVFYEIPTDNYIIHIQILSNDDSSPYNNSEFMDVLNKIKILDSVGTINYNENSSSIVINWNFVLKLIIPLIIVIVITIGIIIFIKKKKINKNL